MLPCRKWTKRSRKYKGTDALGEEKCLPLICLAEVEECASGRKLLGLRNEVVHKTVVHEVTEVSWNSEWK